VVTHFRKWALGSLPIIRAPRTTHHAPRIKARESCDAKRGRRTTNQGARTTRRGQSTTHHESSDLARDLVTTHHASRIKAHDASASRRKPRATDQGARRKNRFAFLAKRRERRNDGRREGAQEIGARLRYEKSR